MVGIACHTKICMSFFFIHTSMKWKKSTVNSSNLISNHFHAKFQGKQLWNKVKFKLNRKRKNKLTNNGQGGMIIKFQAAIFERIRNVQIQALQTVFICLLSLPFLCLFHLWFKCYQHHIVHNDLTCDSATCSLTLCHFTENRWVKCPVHFFRRNIFHSLSYEQNVLTNRTAWKLMKIKRKLNYFDIISSKSVLIPFYASGFKLFATSMLMVKTWSTFSYLYVLYKMIQA